MNKNIGFVISFFLIIAGAGLLFLWMNRPVTILVDGEPRVIWTRALTAGWAIRDAGLEVGSKDRLIPTARKWLGLKDTISLTHASQISFWSVGERVPKIIWSTNTIPGNLAALAGIRLFPGDQLRWDGLPVLPGSRLPLSRSLALEFEPAVVFTIQDSGSPPRQLSSTAHLLGAALWENGFYLTIADQLSTGFNEPLKNLALVKVNRAVPLSIQVDGKQVNGLSSAENVGQALVDAGIALQGSDYSIPAENKPVPANGKIKVIRVREEIVLEQKQIPFKSEFLPDPQTEIDQRSIIQPGQYGVEVTRLRVRYEDGQEVDRSVESNWVASQPKNQKSGYGTRVVVRTLDTPSGKIEYWRAMTVYATAYSPCGLGNVAKCYYGTSSGLPVKKGVVAVTYRWYLLMGGQQVYVPGYGKGIIADVGGGIPGKYWIDLGFTDAELEEWHQNVTLYFLTPVPANITWILP
jgi:resuscitation-promoting factor RpfB